DRNRSHWSTSKTPSYTKSVSWQHHLQTLIKQLLVMKSAEEDAFRRDLIDSIIRDFSNSDSGGPNRRTATADNKSMFNGWKINRIH
ncbi:hypothetical protein, partial [Escherichia coli]|uniref:hypothetical protein n=1 Tax=Escherichia coli TaxID=562 RepID=UPI0023401CD3